MTVRARIRCAWADFKTILCSILHDHRPRSVALESYERNASRDGHILEQSGTRSIRRCQRCKAYVV